MGGRNGMLLLAEVKSREKELATPFCLVVLVSMQNVESNKNKNCQISGKEGQEGGRGSVRPPLVNRSFPDQPKCTMKDAKERVFCVKREKKS